MDFSEEFKEIFKNHNITMPQVPAKYIVKGIKKTPKDFVFPTPEEFEKHLTSERDFWQNNFPNHSFFDIYKNSLNHALACLNSVKSNPTHYLNEIKKSIVDVPHSESILARKLIEYKDMSRNFFDGFLDGITSTEVTISNSNNIYGLTPPNILSKDYHLGLKLGFEYIGLIKAIDAMIPEQQESFSNMQVKFVNTANDYIEKYDKLLADKQNQSKQLDETFKDFINQSNTDVETLKQLYKEDLRLKGPAEYWQSMSKEYIKKGKYYMRISVAVAILTIALLTLLIIFIPSIGQDEHWFDFARNTAIITVITAIAVYILRITIKMSMSSHHLSRDAKEREQLTYFLFIFNT